MLDVLIVGGGPAGLNAALLLGRCRRRVLLCDGGRPRNAGSKGVNGFLSRDGILPAELRRISREQLAPYTSVSVRETEVRQAQAAKGGFEVELADGERLRTRKLLLATGLMDDVPPIPGAEELYGNGVYNCPYCDGWEARNQPFAAYGAGRGGVNFAVELLVWSRDLVFCSDGSEPIGPEEKAILDRHAIRLIEEPIARLEGDEEGLREIVFASGTRLPRRHFFFTLGECKQSALVEQLGIDTTSRGAVATGRCERTNVPGLYVAGDASRRVHFAIVAAAEGAMAAFAINGELVEEGVDPLAV